MKAAPKGREMKQISERKEGRSKEGKEEVKKERKKEGRRKGEGKETETHLEIRQNGSRA